MDKSKRQEWMSRDLNDRQKVFIQNCTDEQRADTAYFDKKLDELDANYDPEIKELETALKTANLKEQRMGIIQKLLIKAQTDIVANRMDPYGDGDQSVLIGADLEIQRQILRNLYAAGGDIIQYLQDPISGYSSFATNCISGNVKAVERMLNRASYEERHPLLERRETSMRLTPLMLTAIFSRNELKPLVATCCSYEMTNMDHVGVFRILIKYGSRPDAKDVTGKSICHWGAGSKATKDTLIMTELAIKAARTSAVLGRKVILRGLSKEQYNGIEGIVGGFEDAESERRIFYPGTGSIVSHKLSLKPDNIFIEKSAGKCSSVCIIEACASSTNLVDLSDRLGSISLHDVILNGRDDVAAVLSKYSMTCLDIAEGSGITCRQLLEKMSMKVQEAKYSNNQQQGSAGYEYGRAKEGEGELDPSAPSKPILFNSVTEIGSYTAPSGESGSDLDTGLI